jgi:hypothetical protein
MWVGANRGICEAMLDEVVLKEGFEQDSEVNVALGNAVELPPITGRDKNCDHGLRDAQG